MFDIILHSPEIPPNTGNAMRLAAVTGCRLHLVEPLGFEMDDARLRRAGMDYRDRAVVSIHTDIDSWHASAGPRRVYALTVDGDHLHTELSYLPGDAFLFGPESVGLSDEVRVKPWVSELVRLPMVAGVRSLNLSNAVAVVVYEAWRQLGFEGSSLADPGL